MSARAWTARVAASSLLAAFAGAAGLACPSRNLDIDVSTNGLLTVLAACDAVGHICDGKVESTCDAIFCQWTPPSLKLPKGLCAIRDPCVLAQGGTQAFQSSTVTALQLALLSTSPLQLQAAGPCVCFDYRDFTCPDAGDGSPDTVADCWAASIDARLAAGMPDGLTYGGFNNPDQGILAMAWFQPPSITISCDDLPDGGTGLCASASNMVACAGLGAPPGTATYDITCASCRNGIHGALGNDNDPCPTGTATGSCFLDSCAGALFPGPPP